MPLAECRFPGPATADGSGGESERSTPNGRAKTFGGGGGGGGGGLVVVVVVRTPTPNYLRQASQNLGKYIISQADLRARGDLEAVLILTVLESLKPLLFRPYRDLGARLTPKSPYPPHRKAVKYHVVPASLSVHSETVYPF